MAQNEPNSPIDHDAFEAEQRAGITAWVSEQLGGRVTTIERLARWRPQWRVGFTRDGATDVVFVRGNRPIAGEDDLRFEMEIMQVLEKNGILVPHIYGWMDEPKAFVMDWVDTEDRDPGMFHTAMEDPTVMTDDRWQATVSARARKPFGTPSSRHGGAGRGDGWGSLKRSPPGALCRSRSTHSTSAGGMPAAASARAWARQPAREPSRRTRTIRPARFLLTRRSRRASAGGPLA